MSVCVCGGGGGLRYVCVGHLYVLVCFKVKLQNGKLFGVCILKLQVFVAFCF